MKSLCNKTLELSLMALLFACVTSMHGKAQSLGSTSHDALKAVMTLGVRPNGRVHELKAKQEKTMVYIGTYTNGLSKGIYLYELNPASGALKSRGVAAETSNPSFLAIHPNHRFLYAVNEDSNYQGTMSGSVAAFSIDPKSGMLTLLNQQPSQGAGPCHLTVDGEGKNVLVANYGSGSVSVVPIQSDGHLGAPTASDQHEGSSANPARQEGPHAHSIYLDNANRWVLSADLGLDKVFVYHLDAPHGTLTPNATAFASLPPGSGPRHIGFHPNGHIVYVLNELNSTLTTFQYDSKQGTLQLLDTLSTLPKDFQGDNTTAEVVVHPSGKFVYASNRGHDSIAIFSVDSHTGRLTYTGDQSTQGKTPRGFGIDPTGKFLIAANQNSNTVVVFHIDEHTGALKPTGHVIQAPAPVCVIFNPAMSGK